MSPFDAFLISGGDDKKIKQFKIPARSSLFNLDAEEAAMLQRDDGLLKQLHTTETLNMRGLEPQVGFRV